MARGQGLAAERECNATSTTAAIARTLRRDNKFIFYLLVEQTAHAVPPTKLEDYPHRQRNHNHHICGVGDRPLVEEARQWVAHTDATLRRGMTPICAWTKPLARWGWRAAEGGRHRLKRNREPPQHGDTEDLSVLAVPMNFVSGIHGDHGPLAMLPRLCQCAANTLSTNCRVDSRRLKVSARARAELFRWPRLRQGRRGDQQPTFSAKSRRMEYAQSLSLRDFGGPCRRNCKSGADPAHCGDPSLSATWARARSLSG